MKPVLISIVLVLVAGALAGGVGYSFGVESGKTQAQDIRTEFLQQRGAQFGQGMNPGGTPFAGQAQPGGLGARGGVVGTVKSIDGNTIQLTGQDGNTITVKVDGNTTFQKSTAATLADVKANARITVTGESTSGTLNARTIQIAGQ